MAYFLEPQPSPQGGGGKNRVSPQGVGRRIDISFGNPRKNNLNVWQILLKALFPSPLWGGVRGGGKRKRSGGSKCTY